MLFDNDLDRITPEASTVLTVDGTGALSIPIGTTAQQPASPVNGMIRYNSSLGFVELYQSGVWVPQYASNGVRVASTANITLGSPEAPGATIDGITLATGDRILLKNQTAPAENGIYNFNGAGALLTRSASMTAWQQVYGSVVYVISGTVNSDTTFYCTAVLTGTIGTTNMTWVQASMAASRITGTLAVGNGGTGLSTLGTSLQVLRTNGTATALEWATISGGSGSPAGATTEIQINSAGSFGASSNFKYDVATNTFSLVGTDPEIILGGITNEPASSPAGTIAVYAKSICGRMSLKTKGPGGIDTPLQNALWGNNVVFWSNTAATAGLWINSTGGTTNGTYTVGLPATTNKYTTIFRSRYANAAITANQVLGQRNIQKLWFLSSTAGLGGFFFFARGGFDVWTNGGRFFAGMSAATNSAAASPTISSDPSTNANTCGFCVDATDNGVITFLTRNATTATKATTGFTITSNSGYDVYIFALPGDNTQVWWRIVDLVTGTEASGIATANLPVNNTTMCANFGASNAALTAVTSTQIGVNRIYVETDI